VSQTEAESREVYLTFEETLSLFTSGLPMIAIDTETNGEDIRDGRGYAQGLSISARIPGVGVRSTYLPFRHRTTGPGLGFNLDRTQLFELKKVMEAYDGYLIFHNAKFDRPSLRTLGIEYTGKFYCTLLLTHLINENKPYSFSLDACSRYYLKRPGKKESPEFLAMKKIYGWGGIPPVAMKQYGAGDSETALLLCEHLLTLMDEDLLRYWHEQKMPFHNVINTMESRGVQVDTALCELMTNHGESAMQDIADILGLNPGSPKDLKVLLLDRLGLPVVKTSKKTGQPSFDKEAMAIYEEMLELRDDDTAKYILAYRGWQKSVSSNYRPYVELLSPDGRLRPNYKLHGTKTGRMSCEKPNLQQIPRVSSKAWNGVMKQAFVPADNFDLWEADYAQLELRLATAYAEQQNGPESGLKRVFAEDRDIFTEMSSDLGMVRHQTKTTVYTIQYGGGVNRLSTVFGISPERARAIIDNYYATYPGFRTVSDRAKRRASVSGRVQLWSGRYRHFLFPEDEARKAFNSVIQGGAADIVERTMIRLFNTVDCDDCRMLLQVHDSIVFEIRKGMEDVFRPKILAAMENIEPDFGVKFAVDMHKWGE
jgi:DNA polymerase I